jgi:putative membrane-bound dehydrogenase-like protein
MLRLTLPSLLTLVLAVPTHAADGNRLAYLDDEHPYHVGRHFPKLVTPQWVGEDGVEAVVVLAIDDMRGHEKWEAFLRPILTRLQRIDGRAPVSIMTCQIDPKDPHLQKWLKEGVSLETHTIDHPCPLLAGGDLEKARSTYGRCVDLLASVPNNHPVAFRTPCCDSKNTVSPRFYSEVFRRTTWQGNFLTLDSSVFNLFTADDPELPRQLVLEPDGRERFRKYLPAGQTFVNFVEDYPYPYLINGVCWEFPCATPSDWQAQNLHKPNNPVTVRDWKACLDATVRKQGVMTMVFHPHGWIKPEQLVELIDYAEATYGKRVKFLTFKEAEERIDKNLLGGQPLRDPVLGWWHGVRLIDLNNDGYLDVVIGDDRVRQTRVWSPRTKSWVVGDFPVPLGWRQARFGVVRPDGFASFLFRTEKDAGGWHFDGTRWLKDNGLLSGLETGGRPVATDAGNSDNGVRLRDLDGDGVCELIVSNPGQNAVFAWSNEEKHWRKLPFALPSDAVLVDHEGKDRGVRFVDVDGDGSLDVIVSNESGYSLHLFTDMQKGWSRKVFAGKPGDPDALPLITRDGFDNGTWFANRHLWVQNEYTSLLRNLIDRRSFNDMLAQVDPEAKSPEASLAALKPRPGFVAELVVSEPLVQDPIAFAWGPDGKLWVVEMGDYPLGVDGKGKPGGRVKILEDTKGTGRYDKATVFLDNLPFPTGVMPWRKGVLVTCAPEILYAEDTDGDGKADVVKKLYSGFVEGNQQHRANGLMWGVDNWVYGANGDSGGRVKSAKTGQAVELRGHDFRIRPDEGLIELTAGQTQYGRGCDDWGNWFGGNNSNPVWHFALDDRYLRRNPHLAPPDPRVPVSIAPGTAPVYPISRTLPRFNDFAMVNRFTSACSPIVYRDELFGPAFAGNTFVSEPVHNLVHREVMAPEGVTFRSRRAPDEERSEFLASEDNWFRPTMIRTGPDGALWVADMYRFVIEHPQWIPADWQRRLDLRAGHDKGRIYRVYPVGAKPRAIPRLDKLDTAGLVAALDSPSGWQRDTAQQMLLWRADKSAVPLLEKLAATSERPQARLHALCTLDGLGALTRELLLKALADAHPGVRRHAVRLCEPRLAAAPDLGPALLRLRDDADPQVRMQLAYTLGEWDDPRAGAALGELAVRAAGDRYLTTAVLSSLNRKNLDRVLTAVLGGSGATPRPELIQELLRQADAFGDPRATVTLLEAVTPADGAKPAEWQFAALAGLLDNLDRRGSSLRQLADTGGDDMKRALARLTALFAAARAAAADPQAAPAGRAQAVRLLGRGPDHRAEDVDLLSNLLVPQTPDEVQSAAVAALGRLRDADVPARLLRGWKAHGPGLRAQVLEVLFRRDDWRRAALEAMERQELPPAEVDAARRQQLLTSRDASVRARAEKLFGGTVNPDRQKVIDAYREVLTMTGDARRGGPLFVKSCATCHKLADQGGEAGPDLTPLAGRPLDYLLTNILDPNRAVEARYITYVAETKRGLTLTGVLAGESGNRLTLIGSDGKPQTVLRSDLESLTSTGKSLMPDGLEKDLKPQDLADVLAYLRAASPAAKRKEFPGNRPELIRPAPDGSLRLTAANCEIFGPSVVLEAQHGNLGYWASEDDRAVWTVEVPRAGRYAVWLEWACDTDSAGNGYVLRAGDAQLPGKVAGTGNWDTYRTAAVGELTLRSGPQSVEFRSAGKLRGSLIDLKSVRLVPVEAK